MKKFPAFLLAGAVLLTGALVAQGQVPGINSTLNSVFTLAYDNSTMKPTYSATSNFSVAAGATDICTLQGSATRNIRVRRIIFSGQGTNVVTDPVAVIKRSTAATAGAGQTMVQVPYDSGSSAGTAALAEAWTNVPTVGTQVGTLADILYTWSNLTTGVGAPPLIFTFGQLGSPVVLRGVAEGLSLNLNGLTFGGGVVSCAFEWTEE